MPQAQVARACVRMLGEMGGLVAPGVGPTLQRCPPSLPTVNSLCTHVDSLTRDPVSGLIVFLFGTCLLTMASVLVGGARSRTHAPKRKHVHA